MSKGEKTPTVSEFSSSIAAGIPDDLPDHPGFDPEVSHAPERRDVLSAQEKELALANALRYFPEHLHETLAPEFAAELAEHGRIYMYRYRPADYEMKAGEFEGAAACLEILQATPGFGDWPYRGLVDDRLARLAAARAPAVAAQAEGWPPFALGPGSSSACLVCHASGR